MTRLPCKFLCTKCQIAMRRYVTWPMRGRPQSKCGQCGSEMSYVHHKFRAPPKRDTKMWAMIRHIEAAELISLLDRGPIPQNMRDAERAIADARVRAIETRSPSKRAEQTRRRDRAYEVGHQRRMAVKRKRWARLSKYGRA